MRPVLALVGRPNVGKSTLFNRLTRSRDALVADFPGLTRDRKYGTGILGNKDYLVIDTGGLSGEDEGIDEYMANQTWAAVEEADVLLFLVDGVDGLSAADELVAHRLRQTGKTVYLLINKTDRVDPEQAASEFYHLGFSATFKIAAAHNKGIVGMIETILAEFPEPDESSEPEEDDPDTIKLAFVGRPNVGKSTLVNRILGEERVVAFDQPGTTRDSIFIPFERDEQKYTLIDTAGVRRRSRVNHTIEKFSIVKTLKAIEDAHVVIMVLDAHENIAEQDAHLLGLILDAGRALVLAINKWDGLDDYDRHVIKHQLEVKLPFLDFAERHFISALHGTGVGHLFASVKKAHQSSMLKVATSRLTNILETAVQMHQPPLVRGRRIKFKYAHQGGSNPFILVIHGTQTERTPAVYKRYLMNYFRKTLKLIGTQVRIEFKSTENPYEGKKNQLTQSQQRKKKRLMKFVKKKKKS
ncbi:MAG: ribosome biogenesis GTPase Der [bacterium]